MIFGNWCEFTKRERRTLQHVYLSMCFRSVVKRMTGSFTKLADARAALKQDPMRILHVLDHSLPLHSGYTFRTAAILREQRALGWETMQLTTPRHAMPAPMPRMPTAGASIGRWRDAISFRRPGAIYVQEMAATARRLAEV